MPETFKAIVINHEGEKFSRDIKELDKNFLGNGDVLVKIITEQAGVVIMQRRIHRVHPGDSLIQVTQRLE